LILNITIFATLQEDNITGEVLNLKAIDFCTDIAAIQTLPAMPATQYPIKY
jgi:hypothetical protein